MILLENFTKLLKNNSNSTHFLPKKKKKEKGILHN